MNTLPAGVSQLYKIFLRAIFLNPSCQVSHGLALKMQDSLKHIFFCNLVEFCKMELPTKTPAVRRVMVAPRFAHYASVWYLQGATVYPRMGKQF